MCQLYAILDADRVPDPEQYVRDVIAGGATRVQLRAKSLPSGPMLALARRIAPLCAAARVPLVVNDRADVAAACAAELHLGQDDLPVELVKRALPTLRVSVSTHDPDQARQAVRAGADAIALGPIFPTRSKERPDPVVGLGMLRAVAASVAVPVIAIGGIDVSNVAQVAAAGAAFAAVIGALAEPEGREARARALVEAARGAA